MKEVEELGRKFANLNTTVEKYLQANLGEVKKISASALRYYNNESELVDLRADVKYYEKVTAEYPRKMKELKTYKWLFWGTIGLLTVIIYLITFLK